MKPPAQPRGRQHTPGSPESTPPSALRPGGAAVPYPASRAARNRWVLEHREARPAPPDPARPHGVFLEPERSPDGRIESVLTVLLVNRECPWRCVMCDLWKATLPGPIAPGLIVRQLESALATRPATAPPPSVLKLYNAGSFFDPQAIPPADHPALARAIAGFPRVIVECHPALVGPRILEFRHHLAVAAAATGTTPPILEVALGLETAHPAVLDQLNKGLTLDGFQRAAAFLRRHDLALRVFILVQPPFLDPAWAVTWSNRSVDLAFADGASAVVLIPTRPTHGPLQSLARQGSFQPPTLETLETALDQALLRSRGRVFADLWNLELFSRCPHCLPRRRERLRQLNLSQSPLPPVACARCGEQKTAIESQETPSRKPVDH